MEQSNVLRHLVWTTVILAAAVVLAGCEASAPEPRDGQPTEKASAGDSSRQPQPGPATVAPPVEPQPEPTAPDEPKPLDLGPPLVKDPNSLVRLDKTRPVWVDKAGKRVVMVGQVCQREVLLELFACLRSTKEHEAIVSVGVEAFSVHAGLLAVGAKPGHPAKWEPEYAPAAGTEIEVTVVWKDEKGEQKTARAQDWILDTQTKKAMEYPWVFAGSMFWQEETTGRKHYLAEGGDFICVSNFPEAMLDLPIKSSQNNDALLFRAFTERIPPLGTPVTLLLTPKPQQKEEAKPKDAEQGAEKKPQ